MKTHRYSILAIGLIAVAFINVNAQTSVTPAPVPVTPVPAFGSVIKPPTVTPTTTVPTKVISVTSAKLADVPPEIRALQSKADLVAELIRTARKIEVSLWSAAQVGDNQPITVALTGPATESTVSAAVSAAKAQIRLSSIADVSYQLVVHDANWYLSMWGSDTRKPVVVSAGYELPQFTVTLRLNYFAFVQIKDLVSAKFTSIDYDGKIISTNYLDVYQNGFYFLTDALGKGMLELTAQDGAVTVYDLRKKGEEVDVQTVSALAVASMENVESMIDSGTLNLIPYTNGAIGENVLGDVTLTKVTDVSVAGMTTEGAKMTELKYRQIDPAVSEWTVVKASTNGIVVLRLGTGKWQVIPAWGTGLKEPLFYGFGSSTGGGKG